MKALTLWQPWATLVALQQKKIETRSWGTTYRGTLAIHASKNMPPEAKALCQEQPFARALNWVDNHTNRLPLGAIVAVCEIADVRDIVVFENSAKLRKYNFATLANEYLDLPREPERSFGDYTPGRYTWFLSNIRALVRPIPCRGYQQLWDVTADIEAVINEQLRAKDSAKTHDQLPRF